MRLFIAVDIPTEVKKHLTYLQQQLSSQDLSLTKDFHITLKFLGEVNPDKIEHLKSNLEHIHFEPFKLQLDKVGFFPGEKFVRVVWVGLKNASKLLWLQKQVDLAVGLQYPVDHKFSPHITLARVKFNRGEFNP